MIELGAGTGALSVGLARAGAASVTCTDLPCHLAYIKSTVQANTPSNSSNSNGNRKNSCECKVFRGADDSVNRKSHTGVASSNSGGGGGGGGGDGGGDCGGVGGQTDGCCASFPPTGKVRVIALRWGEEEDIARARARSDSEVETAVAAAKSTAGAGEAAAAGMAMLVKAGQSELVAGAKGCRSGNTVASASAATSTGAFGSSTSAVADVVKTAAPRNEAKKPIASPPSSTMVFAEEGERTGAVGEVGAEIGGAWVREAAFDMIVLSEVLYWPALDLFQVDTRDPLRRTLVGLSRRGTMVVLIYKER